MAFFKKYLALWVAICIAAGIGMGSTRNEMEEVVIQSEKNERNGRENKQRNANAGYLQVDKLGHMYGGYVYSYIAYFGLLKLEPLEKMHFFSTC